MTRTYNDLRTYLLRAVGPEQQAEAIRLDATDSAIVRRKLAFDNSVLLDDLKPLAEGDVKICGVPCILDAERTEVVFV